MPIFGRIFGINADKPGCGPRDWLLDLRAIRRRRNNERPKRQLSNSGAPFINGKNPPSDCAKKGGINGTHADMWGVRMGQMNTLASSGYGGYGVSGHGHLSHPTPTGGVQILLWAPRRRSTNSHQAAAMSKSERHVDVSVVTSQLFHYTGAG